MRHSWSRVLRPAGLCAAGLGLMVGLVGANAGLAGASRHHVKEATAHAVYKYRSYVGGHGKAKKGLAPVEIGVVNQQTATDAPAPTWTTGVKIAVRYVNQHAGGIHGHRLKAVYCTIPTTVSAAARCGQQFANDKKISAVAAGAIVVGNTALESALDPSKKPTFFSVSLSTVDEKDPYGFILFGDATHIQATKATFAKKYLHAKSVSLTYPSDTPGAVTDYDIIDAALKYEGIKHIYAAAYTSADTNLTAPFEAAHAGKTTVLMALLSGGADCANTYLTLKSLGIHTKVVTNVPCDTPTVAKADGGKLPPDWYYATVDPLPGSKTKAITSFQRVATAYGKPALGKSAWSADAFGEVLTIAKFDTKIVKAGKKVTPASVLKVGRKYDGPVAQGPPNEHCGSFSGYPAVCNDVERYFENTAPTVMKPVGPWIAPPKGFKLTIT